MSVDAIIPAPGDSLLLGVRANPNNCCGRVISGEDLMPGAWLALNASGAWALYNAISNVSTAVGVLAHGQAPVVPVVGPWHAYRLSIIGGHASAAIDGAVIFEGLALEGLVPPSGFVGFGTGSWGQYCEFDNFRVQGNASSFRR